MNRELILYINNCVFPAALGMLPGRMDTMPARAMLLAIGLQESAFIARQQGGTKKKSGDGPAKGFWQFEKKGACPELIESVSVYPVLCPICETLGYPEVTPERIHEALEHNDVLACLCARLLLYLDPRVMPNQNEAEKGWEIYMARWRPGKPHHDTWLPNFARAWGVVLKKGD